jgi:WD40 repeat protein
LIRRSKDAIFDVSFSPDGKLLGAVGFGDKLSLYDVQSGKLVVELPCPCNDMHAIAFSPTGQLVAAGGRCGTICVWDTADLKEIGQFKMHKNRIRSLEFTATDEIVSAGDDQFVRITNSRNPGASRSLPRHASKLYATALLDQQWLATAGSDNLIHIWDARTLKLAGSLKGHTGTVTSLAYAQKILISGSYDTHVRVWNVAGADGPEQRTTDRASGWNPALK